MFKKIIILLSVLFAIFSNKVEAVENNKFVIVINPVRGEDFWLLENQSPNDFTAFQKKIHADNSVSATWLLRPDYVFGFERFAGNLTDEVGLFLEVTPTWTKKAGVEYRGGEPWSLAENVFLSGYNITDREALLKTAFAQYKKTYGSYPKTVGAWHIDPFTAEFVSKQFGVTAILICSDQFSTDGYRIWGGWWGVPYYPSRQNLLYPASSKKDKLPVVIFWWASRDPLNGYGSGSESLHSVQPNDYTAINLDIDYFSRLADIYLNPIDGRFGQLTIGLENDYSILKYGDEYKQQIEVLVKKGANFLTAGEFSKWYQEKFPDFSPRHEIGGKDILGTGQESLWIMDNKYRAGLIKNGDGDWQIRDWRFYQPVWPDPYLKNKNIADKLFWQVPASIDQVGLGENLIPLEDSLSLKSSSLPFKTSFSWLVAAVVSFCFLIFIFRSPKLVSAIIAIGGLLVSVPVIRSGNLSQLGMEFWNAGSDGLWQMSILNTYFRFTCLLAVFLIGFLSYQLVISVSGNKKSALWFVALNYFAGSFGWVADLLKNGKIGGESFFWVDQSVTSLTNPQYSMSMVILLTGLLLWIKLRRHLNTLKAVVLGFLFGLIAGVSLYGGLVLLICLFLFWGSRVVSGKKSRLDLVVWISALVTGSFILYFTDFSIESSGLVFQPLWFTHSLIESLDKLYWPWLAELRINLAQNFLTWKLPVLLLIEGVLLLFFIVGNLGVRIIGFIYLTVKVRKKKITDLDRFFILLSLPALILPLLFVDKTITIKTTQFFYYFLFVGNFYLAHFFAKVGQDIGRKAKSIMFILAVTAFMTSFKTIRSSFSPPQVVIPYYELEGLRYLSKENMGTVLAFPYRDWHWYKEGKIEPPYLLYMDKATNYVSALSNKMPFINEQFFTTKDKSWSQNFLAENNIDYIYLVNGQFLPMEPSEYGLEVIFDNGQVRIYRVLR